jgi:hypothetical protein
MMDRVIAVLELRGIRGDLVIQRDNRVYVETPISIEGIHLMDPMSWKDPATREVINQHYCPSSKEVNLFNRTLTTETALMALRFYMKGIGL